MLGIEADGTIKGLPVAPHHGLRRWQRSRHRHRRVLGIRPQLSFARKNRGQELWGFCAGCYYADVCEGGCTWTSHSLLGRPGNNPYCHYRALELRKQGKRERVVPRLPAPGTSFDHGRFDIVVEPDPQADPAGPASKTLVHAPGRSPP